jgi:hypothetical protein
MEPVEVTELPVEFTRLLCALTVAPVKLSFLDCGSDPPIQVWAKL